MCAYLCIVCILCWCGQVHTRTHTITCTRLSYRTSWAVFTQVSHKHEHNSDMHGDEKQHFWRWHTSTSAFQRRSKHANHDGYIVVCGCVCVCWIFNVITPPTIAGKRQISYRHAQSPRRPRPDPGLWTPLCVLSLYNKALLRCAVVFVFALGASHNIYDAFSVYVHHQQIELIKNINGLCLSVSLCVWVFVWALFKQFPCIRTLQTHTNTAAFTAIMHYIFDMAGWMGLLRNVRVNSCTCGDSAHLAVANMY